MRQEYRKLYFFFALSVSPQKIDNNWTDADYTVSPTDIQNIVEEGFAILEPIKVAVMIESIVPDRLPQK